MKFIDQVHFKIIEEFAVSVLNKTVKPFILYQVIKEILIPTTINGFPNDSPSVCERNGLRSWTMALVLYILWYAGKRPLDIRKAATVLILQGSKHSLAQVYFKFIAHCHAQAFQNIST